MKFVNQPKSHWMCLDSVQRVYSLQGKEEHSHQHHIPILISSNISNKD